MAKNIITSSPINSPEAVVASIAARAAGGKIAALKHGSKNPEIIGRKEMAEEIEQDLGPITKSQQDFVDEQEQIVISPDAINDIQKAFVIMKRVENQIGILTLRYYADLEKLRTTHGESLENFKSVVGETMKRFDVPESWSLNLETMIFVPPPKGREP